MQEFKLKCGHVIVVGKPDALKNYRCYECEEKKFHDAGKCRETISDGDYCTFCKEAVRKRKTDE